MQGFRPGEGWTNGGGKKKKGFGWGGVNLEWMVGKKKGVGIGNLWMDEKKKVGIFFF